MQNTLTHAEKLRLFHKGAYVLRAPPVPHAEWSDSDWIRWIESNGGGWLPFVLESRHGVKVISQRFRTAEIAEQFKNERGLLECEGWATSIYWEV